MAWMSRADWAGRPERDALNPGQDHVPSRMCLEYFERLGANPVPPRLLGRHLIVAGLTPDKSFKERLAKAYEAQLDDDTLTTEQLLQLALNT